MTAPIRTERAGHVLVVTINRPAVRNAFDNATSLAMNAAMDQLDYDTVVHSADQLAYLVKRYGASQLLLGTDYPFDMGETDPVGLLDATPGLSDDDRAAIAYGNARRLLGLAR